MNPAIAQVIQHAPAPIRVLWLQDDRPGHLNKVKGFLASIGKRVPLEITAWDVDWRLPWLRHILARLHDTPFLPPPSLMIRNFPPSGNFDLIISSGGLTQWPNALLAKRMGVPNVYIGSPHHFSHDSFTLVPMMDPPHGDPPFLKMSIMPSEVSPDAARHCAEEHFPDVKATAWTLLIGGDGDGLQWSKEDIMTLADRFLHQAGEADRKVFIATSRRTPERVEIALRERFEGHPGLLSGAWFHASGGKTTPLLALLGAAERIIVTADSVSMTNEAVAAGVPTVAVYPTRGTPKTRHGNQFAVLISAGQIAQTHLAENESLGLIAPAGGWKLITGDQHAAHAALALQRLGLSL